MLPTEKSTPKESLMDYTILIHGMPKIGKSTLASQAGNVVFADTEGGLSALESYNVGITEWNGNSPTGFLSLCKELTTTEHKFDALCIDTVDMLQKLCQEYVMAKHSISHPSDLEWGKGWAFVKDEFMRPLAKLAVSPYGLILISHSKEVEVTTRVAKITKAVPTLGGYIWNAVEAFVDIILYFHAEVTGDGERRFLRTKPSENWIAGDRTNKLLDVDPIEIEPDVDNWDKLTKAFSGIKPKTKKKGVLIGATEGE